MATVKSSLCLMALVMSIAGCDKQHAAVNEAVTQDNVLTANGNEPTRIDDALIAPPQPGLLIEATPETLVLTWETERSDQLANIYQYDASTGEESLIHSGITTPKNTLSVPSNTPSRVWHAQQFRVELCDLQDCVSSERVAINTHMAATSQTLRPAVFLQGERFAQSVTANDNASLIASTLPEAGAIQVHFHIRKQWVATDPIRLDMTESNTLLDVTSSNTGDTLAVLVRDSNRVAQAGSLRILERLGEAWIPTSGLPVPDGVTLDSHSKLALPPSADHLFLHTSEKLFVYQQDNVDWSLQTALSAPTDGTWEAAFINSTSDQIKAILRQSGALWLVFYQRQGDLEAPEWGESYRRFVQGVDSDDDVFITGNNNDSSILIAGWDGAVLEERSPVLWRYTLDMTALSGSDPTLLVVDSLRMAPTIDSGAELRFAASKNLDTVVLGWHSPSGDDAQLSTFTFNEQAQQYRAALELPQDLSTLAKHGFAKDVALSGDGQTLLVSSVPGSATPSMNRAGKLLILR